MQTALCPVTASEIFRALSSPKKPLYQKLILQEWWLTLDLFEATEFFNYLREQELDLPVERWLGLLADNGREQTLVVTPASEITEARKHCIEELIFFVIRAVLTKYLQVARDLSEKPMFFGDLDVWAGLACKAGDWRFPLLGRVTLSFFADRLLYSKRPDWKNVESALVFFLDVYPQLRHVFAEPDDIRFLLHPANTDEQSIDMSAARRAFGEQQVALFYQLDRAGALQDLPYAEICTVYGAFAGKGLHVDFLKRRQAFATETNPFFDPWFSLQAVAQFYLEDSESHGFEHSALSLAQLASIAAAYPAESFEVLKSIASAGDALAGAMLEELGAHHPEIAALILEDAEYPLQEQKLFPLLPERSEARMYVGNNDDDFVNEIFARLELIRRGTAFPLPSWVSWALGALINASGIYSEEGCWRPDLLYYLGMQYFVGVFMPQNKREANRYLEQAADRLDDITQNELLFQEKWKGAFVATCHLAEHAESREEKEVFYRKAYCRLQLMVPGDAYCNSASMVGPSERRNFLNAYGWQFLRWGEEVLADFLAKKVEGRALGLRHTFFFEQQNFLLLNEACSCFMEVPSGTPAYNYAAAYLCYILLCFLHYDARDPDKSLESLRTEHRDCTKLIDFLHTLNKVDLIAAAVVVVSKLPEEDELRRAVFAAVIVPPTSPAISAAELTEESVHQQPRDDGEEESYGANFTSS